MTLLRQGVLFTLGWIDHSLPSVDENLGCFHFLAISKNVAVNIPVKFAICLGYIPGSEITGPYSNSV